MRAAREASGLSKLLSENGEDVFITVSKEPILSPVSD